MSTTYKGKGDRIQYSNTGSAISSGDVVDIGDIHGIAITDIAATTGVGALMVSGVHVLAATTASAWAVGDDLFWDSSNSKLIELGGAAYKYIGKAFKAKAAAATTAEVILNAGNVVSPDFCDRVWETVSADKTLDAQDVGKVINVDTDAKTITLPSTAAGLLFIVRNGGADAAVKLDVDPADADKIMGADVAGADKKSWYNTKATATRGDFITILGDGDTGWFVIAKKGTWTQEA